jgi:hypothetical protein
MKRVLALALLVLAGCSSDGAGPRDAPAPDAVRLVGDSFYDDYWIDMVTLPNGAVYYCIHSGEAMSCVP